MIVFPLGTPLPANFGVSDVLEKVIERHASFPEGRFVIMAPDVWDKLKYEMAMRARDLAAVGITDPEVLAPHIDGLQVLLDGSLDAGVVVVR